GLLISTDERSHAKEHQKDIREAMRALNNAAAQHKKQSELAVKHGAQNFGEHQKPLSAVLDRQNAQLRGNGKPHGEFTAPHVLVSSPAGIAATTAESTHLHSAAHTGVTAGGHISLASNRSFLATAIEKVSLFAYSLGMKLFAARGKVEIQAQSNDLDVIADKVLRIISAREHVHISAPKEILLTAGESYIKINADGIEQGTKGAFVAHAGQHNLVGPKTMPYLVPTWSESEADPQARLVVLDELGRKVDLERDAVNGSGEIDGAADTHELHLFHTDQKVAWEQKRQKSDGSRFNIITGNVIQLGDAEKDDSEDA
ncbi:MAG: DUF2345 domain-containing protein, partial [Desulfovibrionaceae bacterium]|nr:DUF2345 domain-containing protein [Desulfovibrionaceae bacterium]